MNQPKPLVEPTEDLPKRLLLVKEEIKNAFTEHPASAGETYLQHWWFTLKMSLRLVLTGAALFLHGIFPFLFVRTASSQVEKMNVIMQARTPKQS